VLTHRINEAQAAHCRPSRATATEEADRVFTQCLQRFWLVRCGSSFEFLAALHGSKKYIDAMQANGSSPRMLIVDGIGAHYWVDRATRSTPLPATDMQPAARTVPPLNLQNIFSAVTVMMRDLAKDHRLSIMASKASISGAAPEGNPHGGSAAHRDFLPITWREYVTHRLILHPPVPNEVPTPAAGSRNPETRNSRCNVYRAQWEAPPHDKISHFRITTSGLTTAV
ncbi:DNA repair protein xrcc2, partial [Cymbomonas tetramitiformis]